MSYKTKMKIEKIIYGILAFSGFAGIGACMGYFLGSTQKALGDSMNGLVSILAVIVDLLLMYLIYFINICLHETGHMIFGLLTGYKFNSIRFGKLLISKKDGKIRLSRYSMPGTGGQCIMTAPDVSIEEMPVVLYNLGGIIVNFFLALIGLGIYFGFIKSVPTVGMFGLISTLIALLVCITNGLPFVQLGTDGANVIILSKDLYARKAFVNQLEVVKYLAQDKAINEMPKELFEFDRTVPMDNPLVTAQAVNCYNYLSVNKKFEEAKDMALFILNNARSINQLHAKVLQGELIFLYAVVDKNIPLAKEEFKKHEKEMKQAAQFISMQRILYAYYTLVEQDEKKACDYEKKFMASVKRYPYPKDAANEMEQFEMVKASLE